MIVIIASTILGVLFWIAGNGNLFFGDVFFDNVEKSLHLLRTFTVVTQGVLWIAVIIYLKSILEEFSVFVGGLYFVIRGLGAFVVSVGILLISFSLMFLTVYTGSELCTKGEDDEYLIPHENCYESFPHCSFGNSTLKVFTMMMGEIGSDCRYNIEDTKNTTLLVDSPNWIYASYTSQVYYFLYVFIVVITLSTVLIAVVTDSFAYIKKERSAMVFWSNRLDFVAEVDSISLFTNMVARGFGCKDDEQATDSAIQETPGGTAIHVSSNRQAIMIEADKNDAFRRAWSDLLDVFQSNFQDSEDTPFFSKEFWQNSLVKTIAIVVVPIWIIAGFVSAGLLWPPQIREMLFDRKINSSPSVVENNLHHEIDQLKREIKFFQGEVKKEIQQDQLELSSMKAEVEIVQREVLTDLAQVKEIMSTLYEITRERTISG